MTEKQELNVHTERERERKRPSDGFRFNYLDYLRRFSGAQNVLYLPEETLLSFIRCNINHMCWFSWRRKLIVVNCQSREMKFHSDSSLDRLSNRRNVRLADREKISRRKHRKWLMYMRNASTRDGEMEKERERESDWWRKKYSTSNETSCYYSVIIAHWRDVVWVASFILQQEPDENRIEAKADVEPERRVERRGEEETSAFSFHLANSE